MKNPLFPTRYKVAQRITVGVILTAFLTLQILAGPASAQVLALPTPGTMVNLSPGFAPAVLRGIKVYPQNPFQFDFIVDTGASNLKDEALKKESAKLIKYFLASLTVPEDDLWVNLSPYEKDRIIPAEFGTTEMGMELLAQDYLLKQLTASLIYPESDLGKSFWEKVYTKAQRLYGTTQIPVNTFNKVWVVPDKAVVYESDEVAFVGESHLKVMLEADYLAGELSAAPGSKPQNDVNDLSKEIIKEVVLPEIEKEVNEGRNFAGLRQVYHSLILAAWFKRSLKESILGRLYVDQNKVQGIDEANRSAKQKIYDQYLEAFKKGVYSYIKEDLDPVTRQAIPRKYFSGGVEFGQAVEASLEFRAVPQSQTMLARVANQAMLGPATKVEVFLVNPDLSSTASDLLNDRAASTTDQAMLTATKDRLTVLAQRGQQFGKDLVYERDPLEHQKVWLRFKGGKKFPKIGGGAVNEVFDAGDSVFRVAEDPYEEKLLELIVRMGELGIAPKIRSYGYLGGGESGQFFVEMEKIAGQDIAKLGTGQELNGQVSRPVLALLDLLIENNISVGDFKPANIMIGVPWGSSAEPRAYLVDPDLADQEESRLEVLATYQLGIQRFWRNGYDQDDKIRSYIESLLDWEEKGPEGLGGFLGSKLKSSMVAPHLKARRLFRDGVELSLVGSEANNEVFDNGVTVIRLPFSRTLRQFETQTRPTLKILTDQKISPALRSYGLVAAAPQEQLFIEVDKVEGRTLLQIRQDNGGALNSDQVTQIKQLLRRLISSGRFVDDFYKPGNIMIGVTQQDPVERAYLVDFESTQDLGLSSWELVERYKGQINNDFWTPSEQKALIGYLNQLSRRIRRPVTADPAMLARDFKQELRTQSAADINALAAANWEGYSTNFETVYERTADRLPERHLARGPGGLWLHLHLDHAAKRVSNEPFKSNGLLFKVREISSSGIVLEDPRMETYIGAHSERGFIPLSELVASGLIPQTALDKLLSMATAAARSELAALYAHVQQQKPVDHILVEATSPDDARGVWEMWDLTDAETQGKRILEGPQEFAGMTLGRIDEPLSAEEIRSWGDTGRAVVEEYLRGLGVVNFEHIRKYQKVYGRSIERDLKPKIAYLQGLGIRQLASMIERYPNILVADLENKLKPTVKFLQKSGVADIVELLETYPQVLGLSVVKKLRPTVEILRQINGPGVPVSTKEMGDLLFANVRGLQLILETAGVKNFPVENAADLRRLYQVLNKRLLRRQGSSVVQWLQADSEDHRREREQELTTLLERELFVPVRDQAMLTADPAFPWKTYPGVIGSDGYSFYQGLRDSFVQPGARRRLTPRSGEEFEFKIKDQLGIPNTAKFQPQEAIAILAQLSNLAKNFRLENGEPVFDISQLPDFPNDGSPPDLKGVKNFYEMTTTILAFTPQSMARLEQAVGELLKILSGGLFTIHGHFSFDELIKMVEKPDGSKKPFLDVNRQAVARSVKGFEAIWRVLFDIGKKWNRPVPSTHLSTLEVASKQRDDLGGGIDNSDNIVNFSDKYPSMEVKILSAGEKVAGKAGSFAVFAELLQQLRLAFHLLEYAAQEEDHAPLSVIGRPILAGERPTFKQMQQFIDLYLSHDPISTRYAQQIYESLAEDISESESLIRAAAKAAGARDILDKIDRGEHIRLDEIAGLIPPAQPERQSFENRFPDFMRYYKEARRVFDLFDDLGLTVVYELHDEFDGYDEKLLEHLKARRNLYGDSLLEQLAQDILRTTPPQNPEKFDQKLQQYFRPDLIAAIRETKAAKNFYSRAPPGKQAVPAGAVVDDMAKPVERDQAMLGKPTEDESGKLSRRELLKKAAIAMGVAVTAGSLASLAAYLFRDEKPDFKNMNVEQMSAFDVSVREYLSPPLLREPLAPTPPRLNYLHSAYESAKSFKDRNHYGHLINEEFGIKNGVFLVYGENRRGVFTEKFEVFAPSDEFRIAIGNKHIYLMKGTYRGLMYYAHLGMAIGRYPIAFVNEQAIADETMRLQSALAKDDFRDYREKSGILDTKYGEEGDVGSVIEEFETAKIFLLNKEFKEKLKVIPEPKPVRSREIDEVIFNPLVRATAYHELNHALMHAYGLSDSAEFNRLNEVTSNLSALASGSAGYFTLFELLNNLFVWGEYGREAAQTLDELYKEAKVQGYISGPEISIIKANKGRGPRLENVKLGLAQVEQLKMLSRDVLQKLATDVYKRIVGFPPLATFLDITDENIVIRKTDRAMLARDLRLEKTADTDGIGPLSRLYYQGRELPAVGRGGNHEIFDNGDTVVRVRRADISQQFFMGQISMARFLADKNIGPAVISAGSIRTPEGERFFMEMEKIDGFNLLEFKKAKGELSASEIDNLKDLLWLMLENRIGVFDLGHADNIMIGRKKGSVETRAYLVDAELAQRMSRLSLDKLIKIYREKVIELGQDSGLDIAGIVGFLDSLDKRNAPPDQAMLSQPNEKLAAELRYEPSGQLDTFNIPLHRLTHNGRELSRIGFGGSNEVFDLGDTVIRMERSTSAVTTLAEYLRDVEMAGLLADLGISPALRSFGFIRDPQGDRFFMEIDKVKGLTLGQIKKANNGQLPADVVAEVKRLLRVVIANNLSIGDFIHPGNIMMIYSQDSRLQRGYFVDPDNVLTMKDRVQLVDMYRHGVATLDEWLGAAQDELLEYLDALKAEFKQTKTDPAMLAAKLRFEATDQKDAIGDTVHRLSHDGKELSRMSGGGANEIFDFGDTVIRVSKSRKLYQDDLGRWEQAVQMLGEKGLGPRLVATGYVDNLGDGGPRYFVQVEKVEGKTLGQLKQPDGKLSSEDLDKVKQLLRGLIDNRAEVQDFFWEGNVLIGQRPGERETRAYLVDPDTLEIDAPKAAWESAAFYQYWNSGAKIDTADLFAYLNSLRQELSRADPAMLARNVGGINLNPAQLNLIIQRDKNGAPAPVAPELLQNIRINGLAPIIINMTPLNNIPLFLGGTDTAPPLPLAALNPQIKEMAK